MANKKKLATSVAAVATAAAVLLGGTFAWQSISQTALNEASDVVNPGGRLHNDMWYVSETENNNDIYVENFGEEPIVARVRLSEYMEVVLNYGTNGELEKQLIGTKTVKNGVSEEEIAASPNGADLYDYQYRLFTDYTDTVEFAAGNDGENEPYWTWTTGGETVYMPTFNMNKDSLEADLYGLYADRVGGISNRVAAQYLDNDGVAITGGYTDDEALTANEIWDYDSNMTDELADGGVDISALIHGSSELGAEYENNVALKSETHIAKNTRYAELISMSEWLSWFYDEENGEYNADWYTAKDYGNYWVYDDSEDGNGWVYWSAHIGAKSATGLLLDGITLNQVMDDSWYYAIEAEGQFCTPDDTGVMPTGYSLDEEESTEGTGFYANGETVSDQALTFLSIIGVTDDTPGYEDDEPEDPEQSYTMHVYADAVDGVSASSYLIPNVEYLISVCAEENEYGDTYVDITVLDENDEPLTAGEDYTIEESSVQFEDPDGTYGDSYAKEATAKLTIKNEKLVGQNIQIVAIANNEEAQGTGNKGTLNVPVHWEELSVQIALYDSDGNEVTGNTLTPISTYDVVGTITNTAGTSYVIYSSVATQPIPDNIKVVHDDANYIVAHTIYTEDTYINDDGQLVVGTEAQFDDDKGLTLSIGADSVLVYESAAAKESGGEHLVQYYAYGQHDYYPTGQERYHIDMSEEITVSASDQDEPFRVYDSTNVEITNKEGLSYKVTGNTSNETKIEDYSYDEYDTCKVLKIGSDEKADVLTITVSDDNGSVEETVTIQYLPSLSIGENTSDWWNDLYIDSGSTEKTYELALKDYWGDEVSNVTFAVSGADYDGTHVDGDTLYIAAEEAAYPMTLTVTVDGEETEYYVYVSYYSDPEPVV